MSVDLNEEGFAQGKALDTLAAKASSTGRPPAQLSLSPVDKEGFAQGKALDTLAAKASSTGRPPAQLSLSPVDDYGRRINYLRLSITDRCNLRCRYCMPAGLENRKVTMTEILGYEELLRVAEAAAALGINRFKITGGEPLCRRDCVSFIGRLKRLPGVEQVTLTTNGILLAETLPQLLSAGLDAVNISLDSLDPQTYADITGYDALPRVLAGLEAALSAGLPVKLNTVLTEDGNAGDWPALLALAEAAALDVRFIELMPIGCGRQQRGVSNVTLLEEIRARYPGIERDTQRHGNGPAVYYRIPGFRGSVGFISAVHEKFCSTCNRLRLTSQGQLKPCLCYGEAVDLRAILRRPDSDAALLQAAIRQAVRQKPRAHCFEDITAVTEGKEMVKIGG